MSLVSYWCMFYSGRLSDQVHIVFSSPELKALLSCCHSALSVCLSSYGINFHIFDFSSETDEQNSTKLDRKQDLSVLYQVCVFRANPKNRMAALASDWRIGIPLYGVRLSVHVSVW